MGHYSQQFLFCNSKKALFSSSRKEIEPWRLEGHAEHTEYISPRSAKEEERGGACSGKNRNSRVPTQLDTRLHWTRLSLSLAWYDSLLPAATLFATVTYTRLAMYVENCTYSWIVLTCGEGSMHYVITEGWQFIHLKHTINDILSIHCC